MLKTFIQINNKNLISNKRSRFLVCFKISFSYIYFFFKEEIQKEYLKS